MNIPDSTSVAAYDVAKRVYEGSLTREAGLSSLTAAHSMNRNSAADYLGIFSCIVEGAATRAQATLSPLTTI